MAREKHETKIFLLDLQVGTLWMATLGSQVSLRAPDHRVVSGPQRASCKALTASHAWPLPRQDHTSAIVVHDLQWVPRRIKLWKLRVPFCHGDNTHLIIAGVTHLWWVGWGALILQGDRCEREEFLSTVFRSNVARAYGIAFKVGKNKWKADFLPNKIASG